MAEEKSSFILYCDLIHTVEKLPIEKAGELFMHILKYVNDKNPESDDLLLNIAFEPIKQTLKRDLKRYESKKQDRSLAGRMGNLQRYNSDLYDNVKSNRITLEQAEELAKRRKTRKSEKDLANVAVNDSVSVSVSVSDSVNDKENKNTPSAFSFYYSLLNSGASKQFASEWIKVRKNKKLTNTETALKKFMNQVKKSGYSLNEVLEKCIEKSWGGFEASWYNKPNNKSGTNQPLMIYDENDKLIR